MVGGIPRPFGEDEPPKGNKAVAAAAVVFALSGLAGGGLGAATAGEASGELSVRAPRSESNAARAGRTEVDAQISGIRDALKVTSRLRRSGYRVTFQAEHKDHACADNSDGDVQVFFRENECLSLYRVVYEIQDRYNTYLLSMTTVIMPNEQTAITLQELLDQGTSGAINLLIPPSGKYRDFPFIHTRASTTRNAATVTTFDLKPVGRTLGSAVLDALLSNAKIALW
jgi:hypothetical protein